MIDALDMALFGPAGTPKDFEELGYKSSMDMPKYLEKNNLNAFEYQCGQGVKIGEVTARKLGEALKAVGVAVSLHAPYFISLSSVDEEKRDKSIDYIFKSVQAAAWMGADRVVIHSGSCSGISRVEALELAKDTLRRAKDFLNASGLDLSGVRLCPETMGKINQLGDLNEVMELCLIDDSFLPCIDFGHLNARTFGGLNGREIEGYTDILNTIENRLGSERLKSFHSHFSMIEYTQKGGEKKHLTFDDTVYGPKYEPLMELVAKKLLTPRFICESAGTQGRDAGMMKKKYMSYR